MKVVNIIGARPQFIKVGIVNKSLIEKPEFNSVIVHTGQHYDDEMSAVFFRELELPTPDVQLEVGMSFEPAYHIGKILERIYPVLESEKYKLRLRT